MAFVLFLSDQAPACEDAYARRLGALLGAVAVPIAGRVPVPDEAGYAAARAAWEAFGAEVRPLIASSVLPAFAPLADLFLTRRAAVLIHEPIGSVAESPDRDRQLLVAVQRRVLALAPSIVTSSEAAANAIAVGAAIPHGRIAVIEPPTPELGRAHGSAGLEAMIFSPDAPSAGNRHGVLLAALAGLADLDWQLCVAGPAAAGTTHLDELAGLAGELGLASRVRFAVASETLWRASDLFARGSSHLGYDLATAAALKRGLPVVICGDERSRPAIPSEAGAIAPPGDRAQLGKALRRLIFDRGLRKLMAEGAWQAGQALPRSEVLQAQLLAALE